MSSSYRDLFKGTAPYYARYRPQYPAEFFAAVVAYFGLDGTGRLLDLGCGTGQLLIPLASSFETAFGMDPEPEMLAEAQRVAAEAAITNATWIEGGSDDLARLRDRIAPLRLTTMGRAFHWMNSDQTLAALGAMTVTSGGVVLCGESCDIWQSDAEWQRAVRDVISRQLGDERRAGSGTYQQAKTPHEPWADVLQRSPFPNFENQTFEYQRDLDLDDVVGFLYSTSFASPAVLGDRRPAFERDLRETLAPLADDGRFIEHLVLDTFLARKR